MNKRAFISFLPCVGFSGFALAADTQNRVKFELTPEICSKDSPGSLWGKKLEVDSEASSEQEQTRFHEEYEAKLREWTDLKQPAAKAVRPHVTKAYMSAMEYIVLDVHGGLIHVLPRFPADIEWHIWNGFNLGFAEHGASIGRYTHKMIAELLVTIFEAYAEPYKKLADSQSSIDDCLKALIEAERLLPQQGALYFRTHLVREIRGWL